MPLWNSIMNEITSIPSSYRIIASLKHYYMERMTAAGSSYRFIPHGSAGGDGETNRVSVQAVRE